MPARSLAKMRIRWEPSAKPLRMWGLESEERGPPSRSAEKVSWSAEVPSSLPVKVKVADVRLVSSVGPVTMMVSGA